MIHTYDIYHTYVGTNIKVTDKLGVIGVSAIDDTIAYRHVYNIIIYVNTNYTCNVSHYQYFRKFLLESDFLAT